MTLVLSILLSAALSLGGFSGQREGRDPLLDLYYQAYSTKVLTFSSVPAAYCGGPAAPEYVQMEKRLQARQDRVRAILVIRFGDAAIERIEQDAENELSGVFFTDRAAAVEWARGQYPAQLRKLERGVARPNLPSAAPTPPQRAP